MPKQTSLFPDDNYADFLNSLKQRMPNRPGQGCPGGESAAGAPLLADR
jgi:hypothetical protein